MDDWDGNKDKWWLLVDKAELKVMIEVCGCTMVINVTKKRNREKLSPGLESGKAKLRAAIPQWNGPRVTCRVPSTIPHIHLAALFLNHSSKIMSFVVCRLHTTTAYSSDGRTIALYAAYLAIQLATSSAGTL